MKRFFWERRDDRYLFLIFDRKSSHVHAIAWTEDEYIAEQICAALNERVAKK